MTEFAFSGIGINPHYGTPANPYDRGSRRIRAGLLGRRRSVSDGMAAFALGTDTGGSVRIPAALCGVAGFKPTAARVPRDGAFPLSTTLDSVGRSLLRPPAAPRFSRCWRAIPAAAAPGSARRYASGDTEESHARRSRRRGGEAFQAACSACRAAARKIVELAVPEFDEAARASVGGGISPPEAYAVHRKWIERSRISISGSWSGSCAEGPSLRPTTSICSATRARLVKRFARKSTTSTR